MQKSEAQNAEVRSVKRRSPKRKTQKSEAQNAEVRSVKRRKLERKTQKRKTQKIEAQNAEVEAQNAKAKAQKPKHKTKKEAFKVEKENILQNMKINLDVSNKSNKIAGLIKKIRMNEKRHRTIFIAANAF